MATNTNWKIGTSEAEASSRIDAESMSTSPILDTAKVRAKLRLKRRTSGDSTSSSAAAFLPNPVKSTEKSKTHVDDAPNFSVSERVCELSTNADESLTNRLRDLKRRKKIRTSEPTDARIADEDFFKSAKLLDRAFNADPSRKMLPSPKRYLGLCSFGEFERSTCAEPETPTISGSVTHLSLDEDKEEDLFADAKENVDAAENVEEFSQWKYDIRENSPSRFHGFSSEEYYSSRDRSERISQFRDNNDFGNDENACFRGFSFVDADESRRSLENWKYSLRMIYPDFADRTNWFEKKFPTSDEKKPERGKNNTNDLTSDEAKKKTNVIFTDETKKNTNNFPSDETKKINERRDVNDRCSVVEEKISEIEPCGKNVAIVKDPVNFGTSGNWKKRLAARGLMTRAEVSSPTGMKSNDDKSTTDRKSEQLSEFSGGKCGFSTAGGRSIVVSEAAIARATELLSETSEIIEAKTVDHHESSDESVSRSDRGFSIAVGLPVHASSTNPTKTEARCDDEKVIVPENLFNDGKSGDSANYRKECGFFTAGGRPIRVSKTAIEKAEARLNEEPEDRKNELSNEKIDGATDSPTTVSDELICKAEDFLTEDKEWTNNDFRSNGGTNVSTKLATSSRTKIPRLSHTFPIVQERSVETSESAITETERLESDLDGCASKKIVKITTSEIFEKAEKTNIPINSGFATAGGRELRVSEKSWSMAKAMFDEIDETPVDIVDLSYTNKQSAPRNSEAIVAKNETETTTSGFSTASGRSIVVATKAVSVAEAQFYNDLDNIESLVFDDFADPIEQSEIPKKRKIDDVDEDTPLRRDADLKRKKGRYVSELQARKLFNDDSNNDDDAGTTITPFESVKLKKFRNYENRITAEEKADVAVTSKKSSNDETTLKINGPEKDLSERSKLGCESGDLSNSNGKIPLFASKGANVAKVIVDDVTGDRSNVAYRSTFAEKRENDDRPAPAKDESQDIQHESIPDDLTFESQFSQDVQLSPVMDRFIAETLKIMEGRLAVATRQDEAIRAKRRTKPEPVDGSLYRLRNSNRRTRISWIELTEGIGPTPREISEDSSSRYLLGINGDTAENYSFRCADFYGEKMVRRNTDGIKVGDEAFLILDEKNRAGPREFERAFLASPAVDPNLVTTGWVRNHYRWIVWKLASMDRVKFGHKCLPRMLTPDRVMFELKYRYDREIYRTQWPPLRRILERGEDPSARLVLCVSSIVPEEEANVQARNIGHTPNSMVSISYKMRVTDGWYSIGTSIDSAMINLIKSGKIREGTKLMISGAKVVNLDQGCSASEVPESVTLRICSNSTRRAKWDTKLDYYHKNRGPMTLTLGSVKPNGGAISKMVVAVSRVYPILYREKLPDGQSVFRNARCDEEAARAHEARYQSKMEEIYANAWTEFQTDSSSKKAIAGRDKRRSCTPAEAEACGRDVEEELRKRISSKMRECLPSPRDVTPVMKLRIADNDTCALMTVWSTDRDTTELFVEGTSIAVYNAFASGFRSNELQITAGRSTFVKREASRRISYPKRIYTRLTDVTDPGFAPVYGEFDTIGIVASTGPAPHGMKNFETVNLACPRPDDATTSDFLSVLFWLGVSAHGYAKILTVGSLVACSNLEWRKNTSRTIPTAYCTERSVFSKNPRQNHLVEPFEKFRNEIKDPHAYAASCATVIEEETAKKSSLRTPGAGSVTPYRPSTFDGRTPGWSPRDSNGTNDGVFTTPKIDYGKSSTRKRLERLENYGDPPKLPSIVINNSSRVSSTGFSSPVTNSVKKL